MTIWMLDMLYSYLNLESTKTIRLSLKLFIGCTVT